MYADHSQLTSLASQSESESSDLSWSEWEILVQGSLSKRPFIGRKPVSSLGKLATRLAESSEVSQCKWPKQETNQILHISKKKAVLKAFCKWVFQLLPELEWSGLCLLFATPNESELFLIDGELKIDEKPGNKLCEVLIVHTICTVFKELH